MKPLEKIYSIKETEKTFIFQNQFNFHIELDKNTGNYIDGNLFDNEQTQKLFKKLFTLALTKTKN